MTYSPLWSDAVEANVRAAARDLDPQERPTEVRFCARCVISNQRPRITFDEHGICSACRYAETKWNGAIDWTMRAKELKALLERFRTGRPYDVVVPCSGGKDSATVALAMRDHDMHPLCALWEPFVYTDIGRRNIDAFCHAGFDVVKFQPAGLAHRKLARLAFEFFGDPFQPFVYGQLAWPVRAALNLGCRLVMFGENGEAEYGGDTGANHKAFWDFDDWARIYTKGADFRSLIDLGRGLDAFTDDEVQSLSPYYDLPRLEVLAEADMQVHWLGYYRAWHPQANYYEACKRTGFQANDERSEGTYSKYASLDDALDGLHYYMAYIKFGIGRATSDAAHEIRDGDIEREDAVALVHRYDGEFPTRHLDVCLEYLGMDRDHLDTVIDRFRPNHLWRCSGTQVTPEKTRSMWSLKHAV